MIFLAFIAFLHGEGLLHSRFTPYGGSRWKNNHCSDTIIVVSGTVSRLLASGSAIGSD